MALGSMEIAINGEVNGLMCLGGGRLPMTEATPQQRPHPCHQLSRTEGFGHVIIRACREAHDVIEFFGFRGQHQNIGIFADVTEMRSQCFIDVSILGAGPPKPAPASVCPSASSTTPTLSGGSHLSY